VRSVDEIADVLLGDLPPSQKKDAAGLLLQIVGSSKA
jgi:hypothetical protein